jgi:uncharacterized protein (TIGR03083 family)
LRTSTDRNLDETAPVDLRDDPTYRSWLAGATDRFADTVATVDVDAAVPSCPGWSVADLVEHLVSIHAWVERVLTTAQRQSEGDVQDPPQRQPEHYADWYRRRATAMRALMDRADAGEPCWNFSGVNTTYGFWPRRQTHEVSVHTVDAGLAGGVELSIDPEIAADALDELLRVFGARMPQRGFPARLAAPITIAPTDADQSWTIDPPAAEGAAVVVSDGTRGDAAASLEGPASDILLALWKRVPADRIAVTGDTRVAAEYISSRLVP